MTDNIFIIFLYSKTCGIRTQDSFVITGGIDDSTPDWDWGSTTVSRYGSFGQIDRLPMLNVGRLNHACGSYLTDEGDDVRFISNISQYWIPVIQVLLVNHY